MKILVKMDEATVRDFVESKKIYGICVLPMKEEMREIISEFLFENTGYETKPIIGISKVFGNDGLEDVWDDLNSFIPMNFGDFILEFDMPKDSCATMPYQDFLAFSSAKDILPNEVVNKLILEEHSNEENEVAFCPFISTKYCTSFVRVKEDFDQGSENIKSFNELKLSKFFS